MKNGEWSLRQQRDENAILVRLFMRLLPVQAMIIAMGSINAIIDGVIAARFIDTSTVGVIGLYYAMLRILEASGNVILGGVAVLSGKYMGSGRVDQTRGVISLGMALSFIIGAFLTIASFAVPGVIADLLGANETLKAPLCTYIMGYAVGIIPQLLGQQFASSLQLERKEKVGHTAVVVMIICNVAMDLLLVVVLKKGVFGLVLATTAANWAYFLVVSFPYVLRKAQLLPSLKLIEWKNAWPLVKIGFPAALLVICLAVRSIVINRLLLTYSGDDGLSALSAYNMLSGLILAIAIGSGILTRMLSSVFIGEDNREGLKGLFRFIWTYMMILMSAVGVLVILLAPFLSRIFFADTSSELFHMARQLFVIAGIGVPLSMACINFSSYYQAAGHLLFANLISVVDGLISAMIPAIILAPRLGALGVWLSFLIGLFITLGCSVLYPIIRCRRIPRNLDEWMLLPPEFGSADHHVHHIRKIEHVTETAASVQEFCDRHGMIHRKGFYTGLCLEEIAGNIVRHGFHADNRKHDIEVRVICKNESDVILRIKDDCRPFNPHEWHEMTSVGDDPFKNIGIRLVYGLADEVEYQNMLGLNVLTIQISG